MGRGDRMIHILDGFAIFWLSLFSCWEIFDRYLDSKPMALPRLG